jgi:hypothetical protein
VSRRKRAAGATEKAGARAAPGPRERERTDSSARRGRPARLGPRIAADAGILLGVLAVVTALSELAGAANLGVSLGIATLVYSVVLMYLMLRR